MNQRMQRAIAVGGSLVSAVVLFGFIATFNATTNLFKTGITLGIVLGLVELYIAYALYKNLV